MTEISYINMSKLSDKAVAELIGAFVKHSRIEQNKTQEVLANDAGISRSTLSLLERGESVTLSSLIQVLRVLNQLQILSAFSVTEAISPILMAKAAKYKRKRASGKKIGDINVSEW